MEKKLKFNQKKEVWVIAYINSAHLVNLQKDLKKLPEYKNVEAFIPTIKIIVKTFKGKHQMQEVPLLFNYGFFKIPRKFAVHSEYLANMQKNINCIFSWVKDPVKVASNNLNLIQNKFKTKVSKNSKKIKNKTSNSGGEFNLNELNIPVATATPEEISQLLKNSFSLSAHNQNDLDQIKVGQLIQLRGYPWDGIDATVQSIDFKKREVEVVIDFMGRNQEVKVSFDNVFFTVYHNEGYNDSLSTIASLDKMAQNGTMDKALFKQQRTS